MKGKSKKISKNIYLPTIYVSPWKSSKKDIKAIFSDLILRIRELLHNNNKGNLLLQSLLPKYIVVYFWPFLIIGTILLFTFGIISSRNILLTEDSIQGLDVKEVTTSLISSTKSDPSDMNFSYNNKLPIKKLLDYHDNKFHLTSVIDPVVISMLSEFSFGEIDNHILLEADSNYLDNGILLKVGPTWSILSLSQKNTLCNDLYKRFTIFGYEDLQIVDNKDLIVATKSHISDEMVIYERGI